ncbi:phage repressor protein CI [Serratia marcescens]|uniref:phage repressor protein CI n=1 Tax=Serratia marcescens TaxID=615 RepID=UPI002406FB38|nr:phage repressor protein CI [Serratia marcescens]MDF9722503.1 phage repressor protein CI [Serratia marcescens]
MDLTKGGKEAIERMVIAYGAKSRAQLAEHLGTSTSSLYNRYLRDIVPADLLIRCSIETGVSLEWLLFGDGELKKDDGTATTSTVTRFPKFHLLDGKMVGAGFFALDKSVSQTPDSLIIIETNGVNYIIDKSYRGLSNGEWLTDIDGLNSISNLIRIPGNKVRFGGEIPFECGINDFVAVGKVIGKIEISKE